VSVLVRRSRSGAPLPTQCVNAPGAGERIEGDSTENTEAVQVRGLVKSYGSLKAVDGIDFAIRRGEIVALLGPNGAGKTTTIDMILGLARPDRGTASVFGASPTEAVRSGWVGGMLQMGSAPDQLKVRELVTLVASYYPHPLPVDEVLRQTGTRDIAGRWATKLSGGQAQRVRFAAALVGDPDLLVLDEPTSGMDVEGRREFWQAMRAVAERGKTIVFATHYLEEADANADRIVLMARGRVVADGPTTEIKAKVGSRTIRATLVGAELAELRALPGVLSAERHGDAINLSCSDTDAALSALLRSFPGTRDVEVRGASLEEAFFELAIDEDGTNGRDANGKASSLGRKEPR
jgi:ABC-2 type transport system ATP-binding protein